MKQIKSILPCLILWLSLCGINANAQTTQKVNPANVNTSANEIKNLFGDMINVSSEEIKNFYLQHWTGNYGSNCESPDAVVTDMGGTDVSFDWNMMAASAGFYVSYLRLSDGSSETFTTLENSISITIPKDLYLFVFQSRCPGNFRSALDIIIVERPISFEQKNCDCEDYDNIWGGDFGPEEFSIPTFDWAPDSNYERYYCKIGFDPSGEEYPNGAVASFRVEIEFDGNTPVAISMYPECMSNITLSADEGFLYAHMPGDPTQELGVITFANDPNSDSPDPVLAFTYSLDAPLQSGHVKLAKCRDNLRESVGQNLSEVSRQTTLREISNTLSANKIIEYQLGNQSTTSMLLFDHQGTLIKTMVNAKKMEAGTYRQHFDFTDFPAGLFICVLKTEDQMISLKLLKVK